MGIRKFNQKIARVSVSAILMSTILAGCNTNYDTDIQNNEEVTRKQDSSVQNQSEEEKSNKPQTGGINVDKSSDLELQEMITSEVSKFQTFVFNDTESDVVIEYNLYIPESYDKTKTYPLVMFIPDSSLVDKGLEASLTQGWGGLIWTTDSEQAKHESFVLVPTYTGGVTNDSVNSKMHSIVNDSYQTSDDVDATVRLVKSICDTYSINTDKIYATGQSMGCMTSMYLNANYPDLFAASIFVGGQWDTDVLLELKDDKFFYIVAEGDVKASEGMNLLKEAYDQNGVEYGYIMLDAKDSYDVQNAKVNELLSNNNTINFIMFEKGSVLLEGITVSNEHMYSFDYAYKLESVRNWLFEQSK